LTYTFNDRGQPVLIEDADGQAVRAWYDGNGALCGYQLVSDANTPVYTPSDSLCVLPEDSAIFADQGGSAVFYAYDYRRRLTGLRTGGETMTYTYTTFDTLDAVTRAGTSQCVSTSYDYTYTSDHIEISVKQAIGAVPCAPRGEAMTEIARLTYNAQGQLVAASQNGRSHRFVYDEAGRLTRIVDAAGGAVLWDYDTYGNLTRLEDATGRSWQLTRDAYGRQTPSLLTMPSGQMATLSYENGFLSSLSAAQSKSTFRFDPTGRLLQDVSPFATTEGGGTRTFTYDAAGGLDAVQQSADIIDYASSPTNPNQIELADSVQSTFDANGSPATITMADGRAYDYTWQYGLNASGQIEARLHELTVTETNGDTSRQSITYDDLGRRASLCFFEKEALQYSLAYRYDAQGRLETLQTTLAAPQSACGDSPTAQDTILNVTLTYDEVHTDKVHQIRRSGALLTEHRSARHCNPAAPRPRLVLVRWWTPGRRCFFRRFLAGFDRYGRPGGRSRCGQFSRDTTAGVVLVGPHPAGDDCRARPGDGRSAARLSGLEPDQSPCAAVPAASPRRSRSRR
ncbi:MAG: RHS repeat protein, partial [Nitrospiraceae bacterium]|nr:RHS repeat protein [Nitrospiraceae bacterium]